VTRMLHATALVKVQSVPERVTMSATPCPATLQEMTSTTCEIARRSEASARSMSTETIRTETIRSETIRRQAGPQRPPAQLPMGEAGGASKQRALALQLLHVCLNDEFKHSQTKGSDGRECRGGVLDAQPSDAWMIDSQKNVIRRMQVALGNGSAECCCDCYCCRLGSSSSSIHGSTFQKQRCMRGSARSGSTADSVSREASLGHEIFGSR
jgi:hypothetical protein